jgi:hypothetical protein
MALDIELLQPADVPQATQFAIYTRQLLFQKFINLNCLMI